MNKNEYRAALGRLPIANPTEEDIKALCPHLSIDEAMKAFEADSGYLACPPLKVKGAFQIIGYRKGKSKAIEGCEPKLSLAKINWSFAGRAAGLYYGINPANDTYTHYRFSEEAIKFAEDNWGQELIADDWSDVVKFIIKDPSDLADTRWHKDQPKLKAILYVTLDCKLSEINPGKQMPESVAFDKHILYMTIDKAIRHELKAARSGHVHHNCAYCGAPLSLFGCDNCNHKFEDDNIRCDDTMPLSVKMTEFLREKGHKFHISPRIAQYKEKKLWKRQHNNTPK